MLLDVHRDRTEYYSIRDGEAQDGHLDFHTAPGLSKFRTLLLLVMLLYVHREHKDY